MTSTQERYQVLYEISLAIGPQSDLSETARDALSTYLEQLNCVAGAVLERRDGRDGSSSYDPIATIPSRSVAEDASTAADDASRSGTDDTARSAVDTAIRAARTQAAERETSLITALPMVVTLDDDTRAHVMDLPEFGVLVLVESDEPLDESMVTALRPLNEKLANVCHDKRVESQLRTERDRFEAMFETIPEPITNIIYEDGTPIVQRVNAAFETTFGYDEETVVGQNLDKLLQPGAAATVTEHGAIDEHVARTDSSTQEVQWETTDGVGDFLFRSAPVESATDRTELFELYVDVTTEKTRQRKLEHLSAATQDLLAEPERDAICERAVEAAETILDLSFVEVSLHERSEDALVPIAVADTVDSEPTTYTDRSRAVWLAYQSGESLTIEDTTTFDHLDDETPVGSAVIFPLADHGVFVIGSPDTGTFDTSDRYFAGLLSTLIETALDRAVRERGLERIQETTRAAVAAETQQGVAEATISRLSETLDFPFSTIWEYDSYDEALVPVASTAASLELLDEIPTVRPGEGIVWDVFQTGETRIIDDVSADPDAYNTDSAVASEIIVRIGEYGVLATGSKLAANFSQTERNLVEILAANVETAIKLVDRRQELEVLDQVLARILRHNIRNDLTVIQGHATTIATECEGEPKTAAETILRKSEGLESTAEHAREMRAVVAQRGEQTRMSLSDAAVNAISVVERTYPEAAIETEFAVTPQVTAHPRLETAIRHLVENSVEHGSTDSRPQADDSVEHGSTSSQRGSRADDSVAHSFTDSRPVADDSVEHHDGTDPQATVSIRATNAGTVLEIADTGPGIDPMEVDVLDRHGETALRHGSGTGLWIADRIVDYSDATLEFETSDRGTTVTITFD